MFLADPFDDLIQFKKYFLGPSKAKSGDQGHATILERLEQDRLEPLQASLAAFVNPISISALENEDIGSLRRDRRLEDWRATRADVSAKTDPHVLVADFDHRSPKNMARSRKTKFGVARQALPFPVGDRLDQIGDRLEQTPNHLFVASHPEPNRILEHHRQEFGSRRCAIDRTVETGFDQIRNPSNVVDVHVGEQQRIDSIERKIDLRRTPTLRVGSLKGTTIDQDRTRGIQMKLMARAGDTQVPAVMNDFHGRGFS